jgi:transcriptional regulator with XRE-family HTH domain
MARRSPEADVKPEVLKWARESSGWTVEEIAGKLKVPVQAYREWEASGKGMRITHLEGLSHHFKRPLEVFFLPRPPAEPRPPRDFRFLPGKRDTFEKKTLLAFRHARWLMDADRHDLEEPPNYGQVGRDKRLSGCSPPAVVFRYLWPHGPFAMMTATRWPFGLST